MFNYDEFILESQLDLILESIVYLSPPLRKTLKKVKSEIAEDILQIELQNIKDDITLIDLDKNPGYISFTTAKNAKKNLEIKFPQKIYGDVYTMFDEVPRSIAANNLYDLQNDIWTKSRSPLRIGRLINKLFPNKYSSTQIEDFTNKFKAALEKIGERFLLVSGDDIAYWYKRKNYYSEQSTLGSSCMRDAPSSYFEIYTKNPEVCQMLCLVEEDEQGEEKLKARALIWKIKSIESSLLNSNFEKFEFFMDRQYAIHDSLIQKLRDYAISKEWAFKSLNNHHSFQRVTYKGKDYNLDMTVELLNKKFVKYPYMDTFRRLDVKNGILYNDDEKEDNEGNYLLQETDGGFQEISENYYYSEWHDADIPQPEAVYSGYLGDYLYRSSSVQVYRGRRSLRGWYPEDYDDIVYSEFSDEYLHVDDAVYSDYYSTYIFVDNAVSVVKTINDLGECNSDPYYLDSSDEDYVEYDELNNFVWFSNIQEKNTNWREHSGVLKRLLEKDSEDDWIPKKFKIVLYKLSQPIRISNAQKLEYMHELDAQLLGFEIDVNQRYISDAWTYTDDLKLADLVAQLTKLINQHLNSKQLKLKLSDEFESEPQKTENLRLRLKQLLDFLVE